jgi:hypothetical protein
MFPASEQSLTSLQLSPDVANTSRTALAEGGEREAVRFQPQFSVALLRQPKSVVAQSPQMLGDAPLLAEGDPGRPFVPLDGISAPDCGSARCGTPWTGSGDGMTQWAEGCLDNSVSTAFRANQCHDEGDNSPLYARDTALYCAKASIAACQHLSPSGPR